LATVSGKTKVKVLGADIQYIGILYKDEKTESYAFDLIPKGTFDIKWMMVNAAVMDGSYFTVHKINNEYRPYGELNLALNLSVSPNTLGEFAKEYNISFNFNLNLLGLKINHPDLDGPPKQFFDLYCTCGSKLTATFQNDTFNLNVSDIIQKDKIIVDGETLDGFGLEFNFEWSNVIINNLFKDNKFGVLLKAKKVDSSYSFSGIEFIYPELKITIEPGPDEFPTFTCECDSMQSKFCTTPLNNVPNKIGHFNILNGNEIKVPFLGLNVALDVRKVDSNYVSDLNLDITKLLNFGDTVFTAKFNKIIFKPDGATAELLIIYKVNDNTTLEFKIDALNIRPDGFNMGDLKLALNEDFSF